MRVDGRAISDLAKALHQNTNINQLRLQHNRKITDEDLAVLEEVLATASCGVTEVLCATGTSTSAAKANALSQIIDMRRLRSNDPDLTEITWRGRESSDLEGVAKRRGLSLVTKDGAVELMRQSSAIVISTHILINRRTCKLLGEALRGNTHLRVIDLGNTPQLNDTGGAHVAEALSETNVVRVWMAQTALTDDLKQRIGRCCVENALRQLSQNDPDIVALNWFDLILTDQDILDRTCNTQYRATYSTESFF